MAEGNLAIAYDAQRAHWASRVFDYSSRALAITTWLSCALFGLYILVFYAGALASNSAARWNTALPGLYTGPHAAATFAMGIHFAAGGVILALGFIQLLNAVRVRVPALHRWLGRIYVTAAALAGAGGLIFIATVGTIGGTTMNMGFGLYGMLMMFCALQTYRYARRREVGIHRAWAIRLFALAIGSWLYRMEYAFWFLFAHRIGHTHGFHGPFDAVMAFFFYVPNLLIAEVYLRGRSAEVAAAAKIAIAVVLSTATCLLAVATYFFATHYWWPAMITGSAA
ncbi:DUF2306 domain-containing protein [Dyella monticola]|uniref:DUF2306 domain-containing protein n=1 Tax=Dyella monticola TaxID=1927958 RepID=A0A370X6E7_9GAMM|nr:DUF2306 domain-containing protein [Dyella monticola]RDS83912.1 DUF2306 domain-containing protein [Dyella monticola]